MVEVVVRDLVPFSPQELSPLVMVAAHVGVSSKSNKGMKSSARGEVVGGGRAVSESISRQHYVWDELKACRNGADQAPKTQTLVFNLPQFLSFPCNFLKKGVSFKVFLNTLHIPCHYFNFKMFCRTNYFNVAWGKKKKRCGKIIF